MSAGINTIIQWAEYLGYGVCGLGVITGGATMAVAHNRGTMGEHGAKIGAAVGGAVVIGAATAVVQALAH